MKLANRLPPAIRKAPLAPAPPVAQRVFPSAKLPRLPVKPPAIKPDGSKDAPLPLRDLFKKPVVETAAVVKDPQDALPPERRPRASGLWATRLPPLEPPDPRREPTEEERLRNYAYSLGVKPTDFPEVSDAVIQETVKVIEAEQQARPSSAWGGYCYDDSPDGDDNRWWLARSRARAIVVTRAHVTEKLAHLQSHEEHLRPELTAALNGLMPWHKPDVEVTRRPAFLDFMDEEGLPIIGSGDTPSVPLIDYVEPEGGQTPWHEFSDDIEAYRPLSDEIPITDRSFD